MVIENPYNEEWSWSGPNEPLDVPAKEDAAWYKPFIAEIQAQVEAKDGEPAPDQTTGGMVSDQPYS
jgi:hypothetical protein